MSTQNVNVARFARNVEWDFFCDFQTPCLGFDIYLWWHVWLWSLRILHLRNRRSLPCLFDLQLWLSIVRWLIPHETQPNWKKNTRRHFDCFYCCCLLKKKPFSSLILIQVQRPWRLLGKITKHLHPLKKLHLPTKWT